MCILGELSLFISESIYGLRTGRHMIPWLFMLKMKYFEGLGQTTGENKVNSLRLPWSLETREHFNIHMLHMLSRYCYSLVLGDCCDFHWNGGCCYSC